ncbi:uncharacterized protein V1516DRAFT_672990 [Lipomyces oligophaga]|uniref:uncharacterized protein n=1 Tax=Lipomyces oligophaga TaxID=45792 RepID=UPI0034CE5D55
MPEIRNTTRVEINPDFVTPDTRCWICLLGPDDPPPRGDKAHNWRHPCSCSLIAHEICLLTWIPADKNYKQCPQCKSYIRPVKPRPSFALMIRDSLSTLCFRGTCLLTGHMIMSTAVQSGLSLCFGTGSVAIASLFSAQETVQIVGLDPDQPPDRFWYDLLMGLSAGSLSAKQIVHVFAKRALPAHVESRYLSLVRKMTVSAVPSLLILMRTTDFYLISVLQGLTSVGCSILLQKTQTESEHRTTTRGLFAIHVLRHLHTIIKDFFFEDKLARWSFIDASYQSVDAMEAVLLFHRIYSYTRCPSVEKQEISRLKMIRLLDDVRAHHEPFRNLSDAAYDQLIEKLHTLLIHTAHPNGVPRNRPYSRINTIHDIENLVMRDAPPLQQSAQDEGEIEIEVQVAVDGVNGVDEVDQVAQALVAEDILNTRRATFTMAERTFFRVRMYFGYQSPWLTCTGALLFPILSGLTGDLLTVIFPKLPKVISRRFIRSILGGCIVTLVNDALEIYWTYLTSLPKKQRVIRNYIGRS